MAVAIVPIILGGGGAAATENLLYNQLIGREQLPLLNYNPSTPAVVTEYLTNLRIRADLELRKDSDILNRLLQGEIISYSQAAEPTLPVINSLAIWFRTTDSKKFLIVRLSIGQFKVELT